MASFKQFFLDMVKACVRYFLSNFYFSPNDSPSKTMKNVFKKTIRKKYLVALEKLALMLFLKPGLHMQGNVTTRRSSIKFTDHYLSLT